jgi:hypothetical protein
LALTAGPAERGAARLGAALAERGFRAQSRRVPVGRDSVLVVRARPVRAAVRALGPALDRAATRG